jgi:hypothetical protein
MGLPVKNIARNMFGLDWRSLALLRIGLAVVVLCDVFGSSLDLRVFYTDDGVLPLSYLPPAHTLFDGLQRFGGGMWFEAALFALEAVFALLMLVGYRTRLATVGCWFLLCSRQARNPLLLFGYDVVVRAALFWAMFLPLNRRFSLDVLRGRVRPPESPCYLGVAGFCAIGQFLLIYLITAGQKNGPTWRVDHTAVYYALSLGMYARPLGQWLNQFDGLTRALTVGTLYLEIYGPLLFVLPMRSGWARLFGCILFGSLQLGFGLCMQMGLFWVVMIVFMTMLLPAEFWTCLAEPAGRWFSTRMQKTKWVRAVSGWPLAWRRPATASDRHPHIARAFSVLRDGFLIFLIGYVTLYNIDTLPGRDPLVPDNLDWIATDTALDQNFNMFAPDPTTDDGWYVALGGLRNHKTVDVFTGTTPASFAKPTSVADTYRDERWDAYLGNILDPDYLSYREPLALYLGQEWNRTHQDGEQLLSLEIIFMHEASAPQHLKLSPESETLWTESFD